jgi:arylformamidase
MVALPENPARPACGARTLTLLGGVFDLRPIALSYVNGALGLNQREAMAASPLLLVDGAQGSFPPTLVAVGAVETGEFKRQSLEFAQALSRKGAAVTHREIALRHHFDLIDDFANEATALGATVLRHLAHPATAGQP